MLMEEGKLLLNEPVSTFLPEFNTTTLAVKDGDSYKVVAKEKSPFKIYLPIQPELVMVGASTRSMGKSRYYW